MGTACPFPRRSGRKKNRGEPYVVRLKIPHEGECKFQDELRGEISIDWSQIDHQVIQKSDGLPTYHLANVVDDHLMKISHVIRGEEWINSTPKHVLLYERLGWSPPVFIHLPLLRNPDKSKLSKRKNPTSINYYRDSGFLPEAMLNYLGMMGYTLPDQREMFSLDELCETFDLKRVSLGGPVFDVEKLKWLNGRYLREKMNHEEVLEKLINWKGGPDFFRKIIPLALPRLETFSDFFPISQFLLNEIPNYELEDLVGKREPVEVARILKIAEWELWKTSPGKGIPSEPLQGIAETERRSSRNFLPLFVCLTGVSLLFRWHGARSRLDQRVSERRQLLSENGAGLSKKGLKSPKRNIARATATGSIEFDEFSKLKPMEPKNKEEADKPLDFTRPCQGGQGGRQRRTRARAFRLNQMDTSTWAMPRVSA